MIGVPAEIAKLAKESASPSSGAVTKTKSRQRARWSAASVGPLAGGYSNLRKFIRGRELGQLSSSSSAFQLGTGSERLVRAETSTLATYFMAPDVNLENFGKGSVVPPRNS